MNIKWISLAALLLSAAGLAGCAEKDSTEETENVSSAAETSTTVSETDDETSESDASGGETSGSVTYSEDTSVDGTVFTSTGKDENAILVTGGDVTLENISVQRTSSEATGGDDASFYGVGAAILGKGGSTAITNADITTDAKGGAGVFAYGDGVIHISESTIETAQDTSGGIHVAGGGTLYANNVTASTQGGSSAAIRSDRGGGLMVIDGGSYTSGGVGSPAVYCTATIAAKDASLTANGSEAVCIEGFNSLYLFDSDLRGNMGDSSQNDCTWNVILYQSMSGDAAEGNSTFQMSGGTLTAGNGGMFYTTNTESTFLLQDVELKYADEHDFLLRCTGNQNERGWGQVGQNGADCSFTAITQTMRGDVLWDSVSELDFYLTEQSSLEGAWIQDESCAGDGGDGYASLFIEDGSRWIVTGDSVLTELHNAGEIADAEGNTVSVKGADGTVYAEGTSDFTITVTSYDTEADLSGAGEMTSFEDAQVNTGSEVSGPGGAGGPGGQPPEMPEGASGEQPPEPPEGASGEQPPEPPEGASGEQPPEPPEGASGEQPPEPPEGASGEQPPEPPESASGEQPPEPPEGASGEQPPEMPSEGA